METVGRIERGGAGAQHDRARAAGDLIGVADHLAEQEEVDPGGVGQPLGLADGESAYRLVNGEGDGLSGLAVDVYGAYAVVTALSG